MRSSVEVLFVPWVYSRLWRGCHQFLAGCDSCAWILNVDAATLWPVPALSPQRQCLCHLILIARDTQMMIPSSATTVILASKFRLWSMLLQLPLLSDMMLYCRNKGPCMWRNIKLCCKSLFSMNLCSLVTYFSARPSQVKVNLWLAFWCLNLLRLSCIFYLCSIIWDTGVE